MTNDSIQIYNHETGETVVREMTDDEQAARNADVAEAIAAKEAKQAEAEAVAQAKADAVDKLTALGIDPKALGL
jgi:type II secretory pathway predicted ATPase ExeA